MYDLFLRQYGIEEARISAPTQGGDNEALIVESDNGLNKKKGVRSNYPPFSVVPLVSIQLTCP